MNLKTAAIFPPATEKCPVLSRRRSFTLVEVIVAMGVMIFVAMIIATASMSFYNTYSRALRVTSHLKNCQNIDRLVDMHFRNMIPFHWKDEEENNKEKFLFEGKSDSILFPALRRSYTGESSGLIFLKIYVEEDELIAEYSSYPRPPWVKEGTHSFTREVIAKNVKSVSFLYAELNEEEDSGLEWLDHWEEEEHEAIPLAVQMTVEWNNGTKEVWLRRVAGASKYSTYGYRETPTLD